MMSVCRTQRVNHCELLPQMAGNVADAHFTVFSNFGMSTFSSAFTRRFVTCDTAKGMSIRPTHDQVRAAADKAAAKARHIAGTRAKPHLDGLIEQQKGGLKSREPDQQLQRLREGLLRLRDGLTALRQTRQDVRRIHIRVLEDDEVGKHHTRNVLHGHFDLCVRFVNALVDRVPAGVGTGESSAVGTLAAVGETHMTASPAACLAAEVSQYASFIVPAA